MTKKISCEQVIALISFYNENMLNKILRKSIDEHLQKCRKCSEYYSKFNFKNKLEDKIVFDTTKYDLFYKNLSAYMDNELNDKDNMQIKKIVISNPIVRKNFQEMYNTKLLLHNSFEHLKNECKKNYSALIISKLHENNPKNDFNIYKIAGLFGATLTTIVLIIISFLYF